MINIALVEEPVNIEKFTEFNEELPTLFLGFAIKNEYDHRRLKINEVYEPKKQLFLFEKGSGDEVKYRILPLYGLFLPLNEMGKTLAKTLLNQDLNKKLSFNQYESILEEYNLACNDSYSYLNKRIYPVNFESFSSLTDSPISKDKKILQHLLEIDEDTFNFQKFGSFKVLILA